ncbi:dephospho-CoA kinase [Mesosutterella sp. OilRF-GAM-744-9]|uniref:Dephospho-CoA kinase n=1 Tax=Mesosutterella porci TaxID=2915351 RepID=A0ABS9MRM1_9BURK|nr:dephospho-CoA kinase [Mesosutterella sp. oilRF-744-WT-GAM-9]MCG5031271.1 dephospho-CoA kinase [Mesosutterella sp. oilRF-744-WT-GAM-9]
MQTDRRWILGLTGGIASGKTTVSNWLAAAGCAVADADEESRAVTAAGGEAMPELEREFGRACLRPDGSLDRRAMRRIVFSDPQARRRLEAVIHPLVRRRLIERLAGGGSAPYCVLVVPLLPSILELRPLLNRLLVVDIPESLQVERLMRRSGLARGEALSILAAQSLRSERLEAADDVLENCGSQPELFRGLESLHEHYCAMARRFMENCAA